MDLKKALIIAVVIGMVISAAISFGVGIDDLARLIAGANYTYLLLAIIVQFIGILFLTLRWKTFIDMSGIRVSLSKVYQIMLVGISMSNLTPSARVGGEPLRAYLLKMHGGCKAGDSLSTVVIERIFDSVTFAVMSLIIVGMAAVALPLWISMLVFAAFLLNAVFLFTMVYASIERKAGMGFVRSMLHFFGRFIRKLRDEKMRSRIYAAVEDYVSNAKYLLNQRKLWVRAMCFSLMVWVCDAVRIWLVFMALGMDVPLPLVFTVLVVSGLVGFIPLLPGGLALIESSMIIIYTASGINAVFAGTQTILDRLISYWLVTFSGLFWGYRLGISSNEVNRNGSGKSRNKGAKAGKARRDR